MSKVEFTEYKCDVCGKVFRINKDSNIKEPKELIRISVPVRSYDCEGKNYSKGMGDIDICSNCFDRYWEYVQKKYKVSDCYGIEVVVKGEGHEV